MSPEDVPPHEAGVPDLSTEEEDEDFPEGDDALEAGEEGAEGVEDPLEAPVPDAPPPHDQKEPEPVPPALWESEADHLDATVPVPASGRAEIDPAKLDPDALKVVNRLRQQGHQAYFVGGCVRDLLVGQRPKDFDVATSALPSEVRRVFRNCRLIGRRFRLAHVYFKGGKIVEVSTFRANPAELELPAVVAAEGEERGADDLLISDDNVFGTAEQDARRRDFTINGLFYDPGEGRVLDYVRGRRDLEERLVRTIGDPEIRVREDPIRLLRAVRFACKLNFEIESSTYAALEGAVEDLPRSAPPRLLEDTFRILRSGVAACGLHYLSALDALRFLLPPLHDYIQSRGPEGERNLEAHARALDARVRRGPVPEDAVLLAGLLLPLVRAAPMEAEGAGPGDVPADVESLLQDLVRTARLPRRISERCRMMLLAQKTLSGERRRRGSLATFRRHPLFAESLTVFAISVEATGEYREALTAWESGAAPEVSATASEGFPRRKRRRRRRGPRPDSPPGSSGNGQSES